MQVKQIKKWIKLRAVNKQHHVDFKKLRVIVCEENQIYIVKGTRVTIHIHTNVIDAYFHECSSINGLTKKYDYLDANRSIATEIMANLIGRTDLIPHSEFVLLKIGDNAIKFGLLTQASPGECIIAESSVERRKDLISPQFQKALIDINLMDVLDHELDHNPNNYNVIYDTERGNVMSLSRFDNCGAGAFSNTAVVSTRNYKDCSPMIDSTGRFNRPYLSKETVDYIEALSYSKLYRSLNKCLTFLQIYYLYRRLCKVKRAFVYLKKENPERLIGIDEWNDETIQSELSGDYGKTYLNSFVEDCIVLDTDLR